MLDGGRHLWNAGLFLATAATLIAAAEAHAPALVPPLRKAVAAAQSDLGFLRLDAQAWDTIPAIAIDHAVMEQATNLSVLPFGAAWSDLGDWSAVLRVTPQDACGNALTGASTAIDCAGSLLHAGPETALLAIGLTDMIAIALPDAVLIAPKDRAQDVRNAVATLAAKGLPAARRFRQDHRPWGWFETLAVGPGFQVKRITVTPGGRLSLQSHRHRAEHWVVVSGTARITLGDTVRDLAANQSTYIPQATRHRLENPGTDPVILIEVQTGTYLGEDDIIRHEDAYART
jgi:mannose-1-phosphate guanylyltransferase / mannose-6-phosphate isomerase